MSLKKHNMGKLVNETVDQPFHDIYPPKNGPYKINLGEVEGCNFVIEIK